MPDSLPTRPALSIVIGLKDEEDNVEPLIEEIHNVGLQADFDLEVILIDDGSTDRTLEIISREIQLHPYVKCFLHDRNYGKTATWVTGFPLTRGDVIVTMDGDLQNDPHDIPKLYAALAEGFDIVSGKRQKRADSLSRKIQSRIANHFRRFFLRDNALDCGCGLKMFRRPVMQAVPLFNGAHRFYEALAQMHGFNFRQVLVNDRRRIHGRPKYGLHNRLVGPFVDLMGVSWLSRRALRPHHSPYLSAAPVLPVPPGSEVIADSRH